MSLATRAMVVASSLASGDSALRSGSEGVGTGWDLDQLKTGQRGLMPHPALIRSIMTKALIVGPRLPGTCLPALSLRSAASAPAAVPPASPSVRLPCQPGVPGFGASAGRVCSVFMSSVVSVATPEAATAGTGDFICSSGWNLAISAP